MNPLEYEVKFRRILWLLVIPVVVTGMLAAISIFGELYIPVFWVLAPVVLMAVVAATYGLVILAAGLLGMILWRAGIIEINKEDYGHK